MNSKVTIVMYHYVRELTHSRYPQIKGLDTKLFRQQIDFFKSKYNFISTEQLLCGDVPENAILLTFDDGYIDHYTNVFPILKENKIQAFFAQPSKILRSGKLLDVNKLHFILASADIDVLIAEVFKKLDCYRDNVYSYPSNSELFNELAVANRFDNEKVIFIKRLLQTYLNEDLRNIFVDELFSKFVNIPEQSFAKELYMSYDQIKLMKNEGMHFGIHGDDHYWLGNMNESEMQNDINTALDFYDDIIDKNNWVMCYPYGSYSDNVIDFISKNGCKMGFTTELGIADLTRNRLALPRFDTNDFPPKSGKYKDFI